MSLVPPINQLMNNYTVRSVRGNRRASPFPFRYINIAITRKFFKDTHIHINDSVAIPIDGYTPIYCSNNEVCGYGAQVEIPTPGTTTIYHEYASYYAYRQHNSNAFPLGFELEPLGGTRIVYVSEFNVCYCSNFSDGSRVSVCDGRCGESHHQHHQTWQSEHSV